ncbi:MAG: AraC family transcriptional regulator [Rhodospirillaceae bacterium]|nr:MAG: AraC family transcriptional regulator [Rhodospirillaceae bacterium]
MAETERGKSPEIEVNTTIEKAAALLSEALKTFHNDTEMTVQHIQKAARLLGATRAMARAPKNATTGGLTPWQVDRIKKYLSTFIGATIRVPELAQIARLSRGHFNRAFRRSFGTSPHAYITQCRIKRAKALMRDTRQPLSQIALICGLSDQAQLSRLFRKETGLTPSGWRRADQSGMVPIECSKFDAGSGHYERPKRSYSHERAIQRS